MSEGAGDPQLNASYNCSACGHSHNTSSRIGRRHRHLAERDLQPWPRGRCEFWITDRVMCGKNARWMSGATLLCGEHAQARERK